MLSAQSKHACVQSAWHLLACWLQISLHRGQYHKPLFICTNKLVFLHLEKKIWGPELLCSSLSSKKLRLTVQRWFKRYFKPTNQPDSSLHEVILMCDTKSSQDSLLVCHHLQDWPVKMHSEWDKERMNHVCTKFPGHVMLTINPLSRRVNTLHRAGAGLQGHELKKQDSSLWFWHHLYGQK